MQSSADPSFTAAERSMSPLVTTEHHGDVAVVRLQNPPVNALSRPLRIALYDALEMLAADPHVAGIVIAGAGRCFSAGADIAEFQHRDGDLMLGGRDPLAITAAMDASAKPIVAAVHGVALGGGLELALGCHARVATRDARFGLPEIHLGVLPGAGGTQRLPRLVGYARAAEMMMGGAPVDAATALDCGLIDALIEDELIAGALTHVRRLLAQPSLRRRARDLPPPQRPQESARATPAPRGTAFAAGCIAECLDAATRLPFDEALRFEREAFLRCNASPAAAALQHGFFARREAAKVADLPSATLERPLRSAAVVGGGTMGRGIAMALANAGLPVTIVEADAARADAALRAVRGEYERLAASGRLTASQSATRAALIAASDSEQPLRDCELVIEAVFEDMDVKRALCERLGRLCKPGAIMASNTSTLDIGVLAAASGRPADFVGLHFFSPAQVMRLLEIVRGDATAPDVLATALSLARRLGKDSVVCRVGYGFIGNRMLEPYLRETEALLLEGATPRRIDAAMEAFGMAMGPCRMLDLAGVDVAADVVIQRARQGALPPDARYRIVCRALAAAGRHGQKRGAGFYRYEGRRAIEDPEADALIRELADAHGIRARTDITDDEIVERCMLPLINEGWRILDEGIAARASDIDVVWLSGYGFPPDKGGPMFHAERLGRDAVRERLLRQARRDGDPCGYWVPAAALLAPVATDNRRATA